MADQQIGKKEVEREGLYPFLEAYEWVTGESLSIVESGESPDFVCTLSDGREVGIELSKITRDPHDIFWEKVLDKKVIDAYDATGYIHHLIQKKEQARSTRYVSRVKDNLLVLQLVDGSLDSIKWIFDKLQADYIEHEFIEIWLVDYSGYEAYGDIELFGLFPDRWWGYHQRPWPNRKPYG